MWGIRYDREGVEETDSDRKSDKVGDRRFC